MPNLTELPLNEEYNAALRHFSEFLPDSPQRGQKVQWKSTEYTLNRKAVKDLNAVKAKPCPHVVNLHFVNIGAGILIIKEHRPYLYTEHIDAPQDIPCPRGHFPHLKAWLLDHHAGIWCIFCKETPEFYLYAQTLTPEFTGWFQKAEDLPLPYREAVQAALDQHRRLFPLRRWNAAEQAARFKEERTKALIALKAPPDAAGPTAPAEPIPETPEGPAAAEPAAAAPVRRIGTQALSQRLTPLTPADKEVIYTRRRAGESLRGIARDYSVTHQYIQQLTRGIPAPPRPPAQPRRRSRAAPATAPRTETA